MTDAAAELTSFLMSRRGRLRPDDIGLVTYGDRRRVPGLRREEVAQLAGLSVTHYIRLEQGNGDTVSDDVLNAVAVALRLTDHERRYLHRLARASRARGSASDEPTGLRQGLVDLLEQLVLTPAVIVGHHTDVVGHNRLFTEVVGPPPPTLSEAIFLDHEGVRRRLAPSWDSHARDNVAFLRASLANRPDDARLRVHIDTMRSLSGEFDDLWQQHDIIEWTYGEDHLVLDHPSIGRFELSYEHMLLPGDPHLYGMLLWTAKTGSSSHATLRQLARDL